MSLKKLAILTTHPIQYNDPLFRIMAERGKIQVRVYYTWGNSVLLHKFDPGFGKAVKWDIPLLEKYDHEFLKNVSRKPGSDHYLGIDNPDIIERLTRYNPDAILVFGWNFKSHFKVMRHFKGKVPVYFRGDSNLLDDSFGLKKILRRLTLTYVYRFIDKALYVGKLNRDYFINNGLRNDQLVFVPHAIDNIRFACKDATCKSLMQNLKHEFRIQDADFVFLFAGKLEIKKDPELLIKAFLKAEMPSNVKLLIIGNGSLENSLKKKYGKLPKVIFGGMLNQSAMPSLYQLADVFVLPSKGPQETWGLCINEAMAAGKPVIVSDKCGCFADLVEGKDTGYVFHAGDEYQLMNQMYSLYTNQKQVLEMGIRAKSLIAEYSFEAVAEKIEHLLNKKDVADAQS